MKNIAIILISTVFSFSVNAQKIDAFKVPVAVKESFIKQFPGSTAKWEKENGQYEAGFKHQEHEMSAVFDPNGT
ncbi:MAG: hypothetical protein ABIR18_06850, partial [Chitinophagaceae bacterium]